MLEAGHSFVKARRCATHLILEHHAEVVVAEEHRKLVFPHLGRDASEAGLRQLAAVHLKELADDGGVVRALCVAGGGGLSESGLTASRCPVCVLRSPASARCHPTCALRCPACALRCPACALCCPACALCCPACALCCPACELRRPACVPRPPACALRCFSGHRRAVRTAGASSGAPVDIFSCSRAACRGRNMALPCNPGGSTRVDTRAPARRLHRVGRRRAHRRRSGRAAERARATQRQPCLRLDALNGVGVQAAHQHLHELVV
eukprot:364280-Chlamydomonas_euryale.AAC.7